MERVPPITAKLKDGDIDVLMSTLDLPSIALAAPRGDKPLHDLPDNEMVLWKNQEDVGLHFPLPSFLRRVYQCFQIPISSAIRRALTWHILPYHAGYNHSAWLFFETQMSHRVSNSIVFNLTHVTTFVS